MEVAPRTATADSSDDHDGGEERSGDAACDRKALPLLVRDFDVGGEAGLDLKIGTAGVTKGGAERKEDQIGMRKEEKEVR